MLNRDIIVIGASAGGLEAIRTLLQRLPGDLPASVFIVFHTPMGAPNILAQLLGQTSQLPVAHAVHGEPIERGRVYVAPPNYHLLIKAGAVDLSNGPRENRFRPAVDPLFRSAAKAYRKRVIGVILSGGLDDGTRGLLVIKQHGGLAVVQDLDEALYTGMPSSALEHVAVDHVLPVAKMADLLNELTRAPSSEGATTMSQRPAYDQEPQRAQEVPRINFVCPECGGAMQELEENSMLHYRCHVGHVYSAQTLLDEQSGDVESALWTALRTLEDYATLNGRLAENARARNRLSTAAFLEEKAQDVEEHAALIRKVLGV